MIRSPDFASGSSVLLPEWRPRSRKHPDRAAGSWPCRAAVGSGLAQTQTLLFSLGLRTIQNPGGCFYDVVNDRLAGGFSIREQARKLGAGVLKLALCVPGGGLENGHCLVAIVTEDASSVRHSTGPDQYDAFVWFDETRAVTPLPTRVTTGEVETYPFGL